MKQHLLHKAHGIVIKTVDYGDYDKILTIFSESEGVISLIARGAQRQKNRGTLPVSPLMEADFYYVPKSNSSLYPCKEVAPKQHFLFLREDIDKLNAACKMAIVISKTQLPGTSSPALFMLFRYYLYKLEHSSNPRNLLSSFRLKTLRHDGLLTLPIRCAMCDNECDDFFAYEDACYCADHAPPPSLVFSLEDAQAMAILTYSRDFSAIDTTPVDEGLHHKIDIFFEQQYASSQNHHERYK